MGTGCPEASRTTSCWRPATVQSGEGWSNHFQPQEPWMEMDSLMSSLRRVEWGIPCSSTVRTSLGRRLSDEQVGVVKAVQSGCSIRVHPLGRAEAQLKCRGRSIRPIKQHSTGWDRTRISALCTTGRQVSFFSSSEAKRGRQMTYY